MLIADAPMRSGTTTLPLDLAALPTGVYELTASLDGRLLARRPVIALR